MALNLSEQRLAAFDRALQSLDERRAHHLIAARDYVFKRDYVVGFIINEAQFQNAILTKDPASGGLDLLSDKTLEGLKTAAGILGEAILKLGGAALCGIHT